MTVKGLKSLQRSLEKLEDNLEDEIEDVATDVLDDTERGAKRRVVQNDTVAFGKLYNGFKQAQHPIQHPKGNGTRYRLTNTVPYAKFVEWGTGDYFVSGQRWGYAPPPNKYESPSFSGRLIRSIAMWVAVKPSFERVESPTSVAIPIARSISTRTENNQTVGTKAQPFMRPSWHTASSGMYLKLRAAVGRAVRRS